MRLSKKELLRLLRRSLSDDLDREIESIELADFDLDEEGDLITLDLEIVFDDDEAEGKEDE